MAMAVAVQFASWFCARACNVPQALEICIIVSVGVAVWWVPFRYAFGLPRETLGK
jgi:hypothetical protein